MAYVVHTPPMSLADFHRLAPDYQNPEDDSVHARRIREGWSTNIDFVTIIDPITRLPTYDAFTDWILNGRDDLTFLEWERLQIGQSEVNAFANHFPTGPSNRTIRL